MSLLSSQIEGIEGQTWCKGSVATESPAVIDVTNGCD